MADAFEYAVVGSSPLASLLAGLLAGVHGRRVCLVGEKWSSYRLPRRFELSVMAATRPETWLMLRNSGAETLKLLGTIGRGLYERVDPLFVADRPATADYLGHMRWMAFGSGFAAERAADPAIPGRAAICRVRDGVMLSPGKVEAALDDWLGGLDVTRLEADTPVVWRREGGAMLGPAKYGVSAAAVILADDAAIVERLRPTDRHRLLEVVPTTGVLGEVNKLLPATLAIWLDRDVALCQRAAQGPVTAIASGDSDSAHARIGSALGAERRMKRGGEAQFTRVEVADGAPLLGRMGPGKATVLAGLGMSGAFLAPALARWICGVAEGGEADYFAAREISRAAHRRSVADRHTPALEAAL